MSSQNYSSIFDYLTVSSKRFEMHVALTIRRKIKQEHVKYSDIPDLISRAESWFAKEKIVPGSKILFWGTNCPEYALGLLSCFSLGRVAVPIDWRTSVETIEKIVSKTKPKYAFVSRYFNHDFLKAKRLKIYFIEDLFDSLKGLKPSRLKSAYKDLDQISEIVFTSGTTGLPKGVVIKQKNLLSNLRSLESFLPDLSKSRSISILPLSHMLEQVAGLLLPLGHGTHIYYLPRINSFRLLQAFQEFHPTHLIFVPQVLKIFWDKIEDKARSDGQLKKLQSILKISPALPLAAKKILFKKIHAMLGGSLQFIACGGAPLDARVGRNWTNIGIPVVEGYGATEVTAVATINDIRRPNIGTVGKPLPDVNIHIEDGEIYIQSDSISQGYFEDPDRNKVAFTKYGYRTGDIGEFDSNGFLRIIGRDVFKIVLPSGEKVFVEDLESKIYKHTSVKETCVVAKKLADGDRIHAYFILRDKDTTLKSVVSEINEGLESKQQITSFEIWDQEDFPRTPTLKIDRKQVYQVANNEKSIDAVKSSQSGPTQLLDIIDVISKVCGFPKDRILETDILATDLEMDSLTRTELVSMAEEYLGVTVDESQITSKTTVADLRTMISSSESLQDIYLPTWQFSPLVELLRNSIYKYLVNPIHSLIIKIKYPQKSLPEIIPGSIVIINHPGFLDLVCVFRTLSKMNSLKMISNASADFWTPISGFSKFLEFFGSVPLYDAGQKFNKLMQYESDLMDRGYNLMIAPQGGWQKTKEEEPFKPGVGYLVKLLQRPVTIIRIKDYFDIWPAPPKKFADCKPGELLPTRTGTARVYVSRPIYVDWDKLNAVQITNLLEEKYKEL